MGGGSRAVGERWRPRWRRRVLLVLPLCALVAVAGLPIAAAATTFAVQVALDGDTLEVRTRGGTVADVLERLEVAVGPADVVDPALDEPVVGGTVITIERALRVVVRDADRIHELDAVVGTVADVLDRLDLRLGTADVVAPALDAPVDDGA